MKKFWKWVRNKDPVQGTDQVGSSERILFLNGTIAEESWFDDDVTPALFKSDLMDGEGDVIVWINSPGGDCFAAAQIYNMLRDYPGHVTVKIDSIAASAASVIAMAGDTVQMSPVGIMMIHNPATIAIGDHNEMQKAIDMLSGVKDSIINAYATKTGLSRSKLSRLMEDETWMDTGQAIELGFADEVIVRREEPVSETMDGEDAGSEAIPKAHMLFSRKAFEQCVTNKITQYCKDHEEQEPEEREQEAPTSEIVGEEEDPIQPQGTDEKAEEQPEMTDEREEGPADGRPVEELYDHLKQLKKIF